MLCVGSLVGHLLRCLCHHGSWLRLLPVLWCFYWLVIECPSRVRLYERVYRGIIIVVVELGGSWPLCARPGLYMTMRMF